MEIEIITNKWPVLVTDRPPNVRSSSLIDVEHMALTDGKPIWYIALYGVGVNNKEWMNDKHSL